MGLKSGFGPASVFRETIVKETFDSSDAMRRINEIHEIIVGSNQEVFSPQRLMVYGVMISLMPFLEISSRYMTFGFDIPRQYSSLVVAVHVLVYWGIFALVGRLPRFRNNRDGLRPEVKKAFSIARPVLIAMVGVIFVFSAIGQGQLIYPITLVLLGVLFSLYGRFSIPAVSWIAWSYIIGGLAYAWATPLDIRHMWIYMLLHHGLSYVVMGYLLQRASRHAAQAPGLVEQA